MLATVIKVDGEPPSHPGAKLLLSRTATLSGTLGCSEFDSAALADAAETAAAGTPVLRTYRHDLGSIEVYLEPHVAAPTLVVFAATPVASALLRWAPDLGFRTVLVETRPDRLKGGSWPEVITSLGDLVPALGSEVYAVHTDHDAEDLVPALETLLPAEPRFIGLATPGTTWKLCAPRGFRRRSSRGFRARSVSTSERSRRARSRCRSWPGSSPFGDAAAAAGSQRTVNSNLVAAT